MYVKNVDLNRILKKCKKMDQEFGKCPICGQEGSLDRTYFVYNIPCECCGCKRDGELLCS